MGLQAVNSSDNFASHLITLRCQQPYTNKHMTEYFSDIKGKKQTLVDVMCVKMLESSTVDYIREKCLSYEQNNCLQKITCHLNRKMLFPQMFCTMYFLSD